MTMPGRKARGAVAALGVLAAAVLSGCQGSSQGGSSGTQLVSMPCPTDTGGAVTLVVGARQNSPRPALPDQIQALVRDAATAGTEIQVVRIDGVPTVALQAKFSTNGHNSAIRARDLQNFVAGVGNVVSGLLPKAPEADDLAALTQAAQITPDGGTVVMLDSGLPTKGALSYQDPDMFGSSTAMITAYLRDQNVLPDLSNRAVVFVGLGDTADPQPPLPENVHKQIADLWTAIAHQAKASCVYSLGAATTRTAIDTSVPVSVVKPPAVPVFHNCGSTVLGDSGAVGFVLNSDQFRDPAAARSTLQGLAAQLIGHAQLVTLIGATSSEGSADRNQVLSEERANAVKAVLVQLGVAAQRITTIGDGSHGPDHRVDMTKSGALIPAAAEHNRSVTVTLSCS